MLTAAEIIALLRLRPHPEGGHFRETFRDSRTTENGRAVSTAIYYLLARGERARWHRVDAAEVWHWYAGAPLVVTIADAQRAKTLRLGGNLGGGEQPQAVVLAGSWQEAETLGDWTLAGCTVAPGFEFSGFELAPAGWSPVSAP